MNNDKDSKKLFGTRAKIICFASAAASFPIFLFMQYTHNNQLRWLDFFGAASGAIIGFVVISLMAWHANRPEKNE